MALIADRSTAAARLAEARKWLADLRSASDSTFNAHRETFLDLLDGADRDCSAVEREVASSPAMLDVALQYKVSAALGRAKGAITVVTSEGNQNVIGVTLFNAARAELDTLKAWVTDPGSNLEPLREIGDKALDSVGGIASYLSSLVKRILGPFWWVLGLVVLFGVGYIVIKKYGKVAAS